MRIASSELPPIEEGEPHSANTESGNDTLSSQKPIGVSGEGVAIGDGQADNYVSYMPDEKRIPQNKDGSMHRAYECTLHTKEEVVDFILQAAKIDGAGSKNLSRDDVLKRFEQYFIHGTFTNELGMFQIQINKGEFHVTFLAVSGITVRELNEYTRKLAEIIPQSTIPVRKLSIAS